MSGSLSSIESAVKILHDAAHILDDDYNKTRQEYFRGRCSEITLSHDYVTRRKAICELHEQYVELQALRRAAVYARMQNKRTRLDDLLDAAVRGDR